MGAGEVKWKGALKVLGVLAEGVEGSLGGSEQSHVSHVCHRLCAAHSVEKIIIKLSLILPNVDLTSQIEGLCGDEGAAFTP